MMFFALVAVAGAQYDAEAHRLSARGAAAADVRAPSAAIARVKADPETGSFKGFLLLITRRRIADQLRKRPPESLVHRAHLDQPTRTSTVERVPGPDNLDAEWEVELKRNIMETARARLGRKVKPKHLQIFDLYAMRHWPAGKVARELGVTRVQVYLVNHRLTKLLKREVEYLRRSLE